VGKLAFLLSVSVFAASAQSAAEFSERVRTAMAPSIEKQRASIQKQAAGAVPVASLPSSGFFTVPWPAPEGFGSEALTAQAACDPLPKETLGPLIDSAAKNQGVDAKLVQAVIDRESASKPCAISSKGAQGLMQLMPSVATEFGVKDPFDAKENVEAGTRLLKQLLTKYNGDVSLALSAYNAGSGRVDRSGGIPRIPETINYVNDILSKVPQQQ